MQQIYNIYFTIQSACAADPSTHAKKIVKEVFKIINYTNKELGRKKFSIRLTYVLSIMIFFIIFFTGCSNSKSEGSEGDSIRELKTYITQVQDTGRVDKLGLSNIMNRLNIDMGSLKIQVYNSQNNKYTQYEYNNIPYTIKLNSGDELMLRLKTKKINVVEAGRVDKIITSIKINNLKEFNINKGTQVTIAPDNIDFIQLPKELVSVTNRKNKTSKVVKNREFYVVENVAIINISKEQGYIEVQASPYEILLMNNYIVNNYGFKIIKQQKV